MAHDLLYQFARVTADQVLRKHLAWLPREEHDALRAAIQDAVLRGLEIGVRRYEHENGPRPPVTQ